MLTCRKPDNPIILCSDAFIQVTGFPVSKIINHNCRLLQGPLSDAATIGRIRQAIREGRESTEVFVNYRSDGTPFWNLLLVGISLASLVDIAPLRDETGDIRYFFGAQVDVSSLFQRNNDLSAILSRDFALNDARGAATPPVIEEKTTRKSFFRRLSERAKIRPTPILSTSPGLEEEVVREDITTIGEQVEVFRSAYGKVSTSVNILTVVFSGGRQHRMYSFLVRTRERVVSRC
jgi:hypothetical protein